MILPNELNQARWLFAGFRIKNRPWNWVSCRGNQGDVTKERSMLEETGGREDVNVVENLALSPQ